MSFYHNSLQLRHSVCEQPMKKSLSTFEDCTRMFTAYHLKTDRATEQMNQNVELYICMFSNYSQNNWASLLHDWASHKQSWLHLNRSELLLLVSWVSHEAFTTTWEVEACTWSVKSSVQKADQIVQKMKEVTEWAQMTMTLTQQIQKETVNQKRQQSYDFKKEDKIWLNLKNIHTDHLCKKFDAKNDKYIIVKKINSHSFCLNTLLSIHNVFHSVMLQSAVMNALFLSVWQTHNLSQIVSNEEEFEIKKILKKSSYDIEKNSRRSTWWNESVILNSHENQRSFWKTQWC
jgi:hypothetical protein